MILAFAWVSGGRTWGEKKKRKDVIEGHKKEKKSSSLSVV